VYPRDAADSEALVQHADLAMYRAKEQGRNSFQHFDAADITRSYEQLSMQRRIDDGLKNNEFLPYYQPIVDLGSGKIIALEALARWHDPEFGVVPPVKFIGIAEESRLIVTLGGVMLRAACAQAVVWRQRPGLEDLYVSVNVSARQFREQDFFATVLEALAQTGLPPAGLQLELTESIVIGDEHYAIETLRALSDAGISIAIDDFGTGYSSLSYLTRLPVDVLKIDQSFIRNLSAMSDGNAIVRAVIAMAHTLKLAVVAEGVETAEQLAFLREEGCDRIQGYLIAKPLECAEATLLLERFEPLVPARGTRDDALAPSRRVC
jgi:EAL domain-containing protein (putative c-di-GMP-specific phosphodiesterase class I)